MSASASDRVFAGSIPQIYERYLVPLIFAPYAADLARRVAARQPAHVLEIAAGTGVVTRELAAKLPPSAAIAYCQGTPLRNEIEARDAARLGEVTDVAATALAERYGSGIVDAKIQAHVLEIDK